MAVPGRKQKLVLLLLALLFMGPMALAMFMYFAGGEAWRPAGNTAHGVLFETPRTLPVDPIVLGAASPSGDGTVDFGTRWTLLQVVRGDCRDEGCREALWRTRQVRRALGRNDVRVQRVVVVAAGRPDPGFLAAEHPGLAVLEEDMEITRTVLRTLGEFGEGDVFVVDPLGNLVMRFPAGTEMKDMHQDLSLLLKASQIG